MVNSNKKENDMAMAQGGYTAIKALAKKYLIFFRLCDTICIT